jgi:hypothetical protein
MTSINQIPLTPGNFPPTNDAADENRNPSSATEGTESTFLPQPHEDTPPHLYLPYDQLEHLLNSVLGSYAHSKPKEENPLNQARLEHFVSQGTSLKFDGDQDKLVPWIKRFRSLRTNSVWQSATYVQDDTKTYDLLTEFTKVPEAIIREQATSRWTAVNQLKSMSQDNPNLYHARILGKVIINSVTDDFYTVLQNYAGIDLCNDGPLLLWLILSHFHTSTITYTERIRASIRARDLRKDHNHNVESYLLWIRHQLDVLTTNLSLSDASTSDLIEPIFIQLLSTTSKRLRRSVEDWHLSYHKEEKPFTAMTLISLAEKTTKALCCTGHLYNDPEPDIAVLHAKLVQQADLANQAFTVITNTLQSQQNGNAKKQHGKQHGHQQRPPKPEWYFKPPGHPNEVHKHDGRDWHWCPKCGKDQQVKWVCTHLPSNHKDAFTRKRRGEDDNNTTHTPKQQRTPTTPTTAVGPFNQANLAQLAQAHAQLTALLAAAPSMLRMEHTANGDNNTADLLDITTW